MVSLVSGGNATVPATLLTVRIDMGANADVSAFRLYENEKVRNDADMTFYGQKVNDDGTIRLIAEGRQTVFEVNLPTLQADVSKVAFALTMDAGLTVQALDFLKVAVESAGQSLITFDVDVKGRSEAALILGEFYRRAGQWKFRCVIQGFNGGLKPLAEHYGVEVAEDQAAPTPPVSPPQQSVNLSKVSLTKTQPKVNLAKKDDFGHIRVNLNWHRENSAPQKRGLLGGLFGGGASNGVDLDLAAYVKLKTGDQTIVQALGNTFGNFDSPPFVRLQGDDRTGAVAEGEWLDINGKYWRDIEQVLVFTFIYEGVPNWDATDGVVTIYVPGQPPIETRLTEGNSRYPMCAIARLLNRDGGIEVERLNRYFVGHREIDAAYGWGFSWRRGSK